MKQAKTASERWWHAYVASFRCIICKRFGLGSGRVHAHHIAEGSGKRSHYAVVPLCEEHHQGATGLHGMGASAFVKLYRVPGETEYGLFVWFLEDLALRLQIDSSRAWNEL